MALTVDTPRGTVVLDASDERAFVRHVDVKSRRAIVVYTDGDLLGFESMRSLNTLTEVKHANGRVQRIKDAKAAVAAARAGVAVL